jgi:hypothetical protein
MVPPGLDFSLELGECMEPGRQQWTSIKSAQHQTPVAMTDIDTSIQLP